MKTAGFLLLLFSLPVWSGELGEDGLHKQDWFTVTFRDVAEDINEARDEGKRLALIFEARGCVFCAELHKTLLSDPEVATYFREHFNVVQYNLFGDESVTDLDGEELTEKAAALKWGVKYTPVILFMPDEVTETGNAKTAAVGTVPGVKDKETFLKMLKWVVEKG